MAQGHDMLQDSPSLPRVLARRELYGSSQQITNQLPHQRWSIDQVLLPEERAVLLGFSRDGNYLLYYSSQGPCYEIQWKRVDDSRIRRHAPMDVSLRFDVGSSEPTHLIDSDLDVAGPPLRVWQSSDDDLVIAIVVDRQLSSQCVGHTCHITVSPSASYCDTIRAEKVTMLRFSYTLSSPTQDLQSWQLIALQRGLYHLVLNMATSVHILVIRIHHSQEGIHASRRVYQQDVQFEQRDWYKAPEFPIEFSMTTYSRNVEAAVNVIVKCEQQQQFDMESFLGSFLIKYAAFQRFHLVNYEFQLVQASKLENTVFMCCTVDLESSPSVDVQRVQHTRLALYLALGTYTGECHVIRALRVPLNQDLRRLSATVARRFLDDVTDRVSVGSTVMEWNNKTVFLGESLTVLHNSRFPISIYLK